MVEDRDLVIGINVILQTAVAESPGNPWKGSV